MKCNAFWLVSLISISCITTVQATEMEQANVIRYYIDIVAPAEQQAYEVGVKNYNQCLGEHGFKFARTAWRHESGDTFAYSYISGPVTWASFDTMQATRAVCDPVWQSAVNPHLKGETSTILSVPPGLSHMPKGMGLTSGLIEVTSRQLKFGQKLNGAYLDAVKAIAAAADKVNFQSHFIFAEIQDSDQDSPDVVFLLPAKNWADYGEVTDRSFPKMIASVYGAKKAQALFKTVGDPVSDAWTYLLSYDAELTYTPSSQTASP